MKLVSFAHGRHFPTVTQGAIRIIRISPELFQEMLNRSIPVVWLVHSMVNPDQFQTTNHIGICYGYAVVVSRHLWLSTVSYGHLRSTTEKIKLLNMLKIMSWENQDGGSVTVDPRTSQSCLRT